MLALPWITMSRPGSCFIVVISSGTISLTSVELFHSTRERVLEKGFEYDPTGKQREGTEVSRHDTMYNGRLPIRPTIRVATKVMLH